MFLPLKIGHIIGWKSPVVTGGADGIGKGISSLFAAHGAVVEIVDQDEALLKETVEQYRLGGKAQGYVADVRDAGSSNRVQTRSYETTCDCRRFSK